MANGFEDPPGSKDREPLSVGYGGEPGEKSDPRLERAERELLTLSGVEGVGIAAGSAGEEALVIYVRDARAAAHLPASFAGLPVIIEETGVIRPY